jgi:hypothetical protein
MNIFLFSYRILPEKVPRRQYVTGSWLSTLLEIRSLYEYLAGILPDTRLVSIALYGKDFQYISELNT